MEKRKEDREFGNFWDFMRRVEELNPRAVPGIIGTTIHFFYGNGRNLGHWDNHIGQGFIYEDGDEDRLIRN